MERCLACEADAAGTLGRNTPAVAGRGRGARPYRLRDYFDTRAMLWRTQKRGVATPVGLASEAALHGLPPVPRTGYRPI
jgi:hypothetical protein